MAVWSSSRGAGAACIRYCGPRQDGASRRGAARGRPYSAGSTRSSETYLLTARQLGPVARPRFPPASQGSLMPSAPMVPQLMVRSVPMVRQPPARSDAHSTDPVAPGARRSHASCFVFHFPPGRLARRGRPRRGLGARPAEEQRGEAVLTPSCLLERLKAGRCCTRRRAA